MVELAAARHKYGNYVVIMAYNINNISLVSNGINNLQS